MITAKEALARTKEARLTKVENMILSASDDGRNYIQLYKPTKDILDILDKNKYRICGDDVQKDYHIYWE